MEEIAGTSGEGPRGVGERGEITEKEMIKTQSKRQTPKRIR